MSNFLSFQKHSKSVFKMSGYGRDRRDYGDRGGDRDRSSHRGYDRGK